MDFKEIEEKEVIGKGARLIGKVSDIEFDTNTWKITHICVEVNKNVVDDLGLKKPMIGNAKATIPIEIIDAISDRILLKNESLDELKKVITPLSSFLDKAKKKAGEEAKKTAEEAKKATAKGAEEAKKVSAKVAEEAKEAADKVKEKL
jgi:sporulation protein YlmC with PRC-barrel domain